MVQNSLISVTTSLSFMSFPPFIIQNPMTSSKLPLKNKKNLLKKCTVTGQHFQRCLSVFRNMPLSDGPSPASVLFMLPQKNRHSASSLACTACEQTCCASKMRRQDCQADRQKQQNSNCISSPGHRLCCLGSKRNIQMLGSTSCNNCCKGKRGILLSQIRQR